METGVIGGSYLYLSLKQTRTKGCSKFKPRAALCPRFLLTDDKIQTSGTEISARGIRSYSTPTPLIKLPKHQTK